MIIICPTEAAALDGLRAELARAVTAVDSVERQLGEAEEKAAAAAEKVRARFAASMYALLGLGYLAS